MIGRREAIALSVAGLGLVASQTANACSIVATRRPISFQSSSCEAKLRQFIAFANLAHAKTDDQIFEWQEKSGIDPDYDGHGWDSAALIKTLRMSDGKLDPTPIRIGELELLRQKQNRATYVFTLRRNQYFAADEEGCNGLFTHGEYFADTEKPYLATFENNQFQMLREFPEWYV